MPITTLFVVAIYFEEQVFLDELLVSIRVIARQTRLNRVTSVSGVCARARNSFFAHQKPR